MTINKLEASEYMSYIDSYIKTYYNDIPINIKKDMDHILRHYKNNDVDISMYLPYFCTIQNDIYKVILPIMNKYGCTYKYGIWPYNETLCKKYKESFYKKWENNLTRVEYIISDDTGYIPDFMNQDRYYEFVCADNNNKYIRLYHLAYHYMCQDYGGCMLFIDSEIKKYKLFAIGEDDGNMYPETYRWHDFDETGINTWELYRLCSIVNDIKWDNFNIDSQEIIDWLYKEHEKYKNNR